MQGEWYSQNADVYRASAERYLLWLFQALEIAGVERTPERVLELLEPPALLNLLRAVDDKPEVKHLVSGIKSLGQVEREGLAGFRARFGVVLEGVAAPSLGSGLVLEDAMRARQPVLFSLDAATYPELATKIGAWILLDLVRVAALRPGPSLVIIDEFSALGREGRHVVPLLARSRESGMACVLATQGLADMARVDRDLPQQITQNTAVRLALRQGSADDQEGWSTLLGGASIPLDGGTYVRRERARAVAPDELAMLRTGEAFVQVLPGANDGIRKRLWIAQPRSLRMSGIGLHSPKPEKQPSRRSAWVWPDHTKRGDPHAIWLSAPQAFSVADDRTGPRDPWGSVAVGSADDPPDRSMVLRSSEDGNESGDGARLARVPEDNTHPVACACDCHGDAQGGSSSIRPAPTGKTPRARTSASRLDSGRDRSVAVGPGPDRDVDYRTGAVAEPAQGGSRPGRSTARGSRPSTRRSADPQERAVGSSGGGADRKAGPNGV
ncbi:MAG: TraM recognition domain-containing protein [Chloroflexi bacterium]|nr:TraM recognition domain-containing protein [Chloroflexota bacterium]